MKNAMKKIALLIAVVATAVLCLAFSASAEEWKGFQYWLESDKTVSVYEYSGKAEKLELPTKINDKKVSSITKFTYSPGTFANCKKLKAVTVPEGLNEIGANVFDSCSSLKSISVSSKNKNYSSDDKGVFFNKDKTTLIKYPEGKTEKSYKVPDSVTEIKSSAFSNAKKLKKITLPDSVTSIGKYAFDGTAYYKDKGNWEKGALYVGNHLIKVKEDTKGAFTVKKGTLTIADSAFEGCVKITSIKIPDSVTNIGNRAFTMCYALKSITMPKKLASLGNYAFYNCTALSTVTIPKGITSIGSYAFASCASLTSVTIPDGVTYIGDRAFNGCRALTSVKIPASVTSIGKSAFYYCEKLASVKLPGKITTIGDYAFSSCRSLKSIKLPETVTSIGRSIFDDCAKLTSVNIPKGITVIPSHAFANCVSLKSITIPKGVKVIENYAFYNCKKIASVTIPDGVTEIGEAVFNNCKALASIKLPTSIRKIGYLAFSDTAYYNNNDKWANGALYIGKHLVGVYEPSSTFKVKKGTLTICAYAFSYCGELTNVTIPDSVVSIGDYAFESCYNLEKITIPDSVRYIGSNILGDSDYYENEDNWEDKVLYVGKHLVATNYDLSGAYTVKKGTLTIANRAFSYRDIKSITIPDSVKYIGDSAFEDCYNLKSITIPKGVTSIGDSTFAWCSGLKTVTLPKTLKTIGDSAFSYCSNIKSITIPDGVTSIGDYAFHWCSSLASMTIPDSVKTIGDGVFESCTNLKTVTIPNSVKTMGSDVFLESGVKTINFIGTEKQWNNLNKKALDGIKVNFCAHDDSKDTTTKATLKKNGKVVSVCKDCGAKITTKVYYPKSIKLSATEFTYNGKEKTPSVTVKDSSGKKLKKDKDYTVKYSKGRKSIGKYTVTVTFKGKYSGTKKLTFTIVPAKVTLSKVTAGSKQLTATWKPVSSATGYEVVYSTSKKFAKKSTKKVTVKKAKAKKTTIKKLSKGKKYFVKVRAYKTVNKKPVYGAYSSVKNVKVK